MEVFKKCLAVGILFTVALLFIVDMPVCSIIAGGTGLVFWSVLALLDN